MNKEGNKEDYLILWYYKEIFGFNNIKLLEKYETTIFSYEGIPSFLELMKKILWYVWFGFPLNKW